MSRYEDQIRQAIRKHVKDMLKDNTLQCTVKSVNKNDKTIDVFCEKQGVEIYDVRLMSLAEDLAGDGIVCFPSVGSTVLISEIEGIDTMYFMVLPGEVESYQIKIEDMVFFIDKDGIKFNNGSNGGVPIVQSVSDKISTLEGKFNTMLNILKTTIIPLAPSGTYPFASLYASVDPILPVTTKSDLENTKVKH